MKSNKIFKTKERNFSRKLHFEIVIFMKSNKINFIRNFCISFPIAFFYIYIFYFISHSCFFSLFLFNPKKIILGRQLFFCYFCRSVKKDSKEYSQCIILYLFKKPHKKYSYRILNFIPILWSHWRRYKPHSPSQTDEIPYHPEAFILS